MPEESSAARSRRSRRSPEAVAERRAARAEVSDVGAVVEYAAWLLEARSRTVAELRRKLTTAGFRAPLIETALERLAELGFLDDGTFARAWIESRDRARPRGEHALRRELALKGVDRALIDEVLAERRGQGEGADVTSVADAEGVDPDRAAAERLLEKRRSALLREPDPRKRRARAYALLARSGFAPSVCSEVARTWAISIEGGEDDVELEPQD